MKHTQLIANIQKRMDQWRRLAAAMTDERTKKILTDMADEGDADIERLMREDREASS